MRKKKMHRIPVYKVRIKMANIIKKIKRKYKKRKLQAERAKMEQSRQRRTPEEVYQERLSKHRNATMRRAVMTIAAVAAVAALFFFYMEKRSYHNYKILSASEQEDVVATNYVEMSGKILRYSPDGASLVSDTMDAYWSTLYEMQNPVADVRGDRAVIADQDGTLLEMFDKDGETGSVTTSYNIIKARVSSSPTDYQREILLL